MRGRHRGTRATWSSVTTTASSIIPSGVAEEVVRLAEEKVSSENLVRDRLAEGMPVAEAFRTYGVL